MQKSIRAALLGAGIGAAVCTAVILPVLLHAGKQPAEPPAMPPLSLTGPPEPESVPPQPAPEPEPLPEPEPESVTEYVLCRVDRSGSSGDSAMIFEYDAGGRITDCLSTMPDGTVISEERYEYDGCGRETLVSMRFSGAESPDWESASEYDGSGKLLFTREYGKNREPISVSEYLYDENGNQTVSRFYDAQGNRISGFLRTFDDRGRCMTEEFSYEDGSYASSSEYEYTDGIMSFFRQSIRSGESGTITEETYDEAGRVLTTRLTDRTGAPEQEIFHEYDRDGREIRMLHRVTGGTETVQETEYADGVRSAERIFRDGVLTEITVYTADGSGNPVLTSTQDGAGNELSRLVREYSADGLLLRETTFTAGVQTSEEQWEYGEAGLPTLHRTFDYEKNTSDTEVFQYMQITKEAEDSWQN